VPKNIKLGNLGRIVVEDVKTSSALEFKATAFELFSQVIQKTPVRTGRARANWNISTDAPVSETTELTTPAPLPDMRLDDFPTVFISNGLHYIQALEDGRSKTQAPAGITLPAIAAARANRRR
jgi:hypothetical protein